MTWQMQLQVTVERSADDAAAARMLRQWFAGAFEAMGGPLREKLLAAEPLSDYNLRGRPIDQPFGKPGEVWSIVKTRVLGARGVRMKAKAFSNKAWNAFLNGMSAVPYSGELSVVTLDHDGFPNAFPVFGITWETNDDDERWWFLNVRFGPDWLAEPVYQQAVLGFIRQFADGWNPAYGEISYDRGSGRTAYENVFPVRAKAAAVTSRELLRGYAWLMLCPQEIGDRLGGVEALRSSGAFTQVEPLENGGYWLLATEDWRDFDQAVAERIFPVLAPVLRPGDPLPDAPDDPPFYVSRRNAAELQG